MVGASGGGMKRRRGRMAQGEAVGVVEKESARWNKKEGTPKHTSETASARILLILLTRALTPSLRRAYAKPGEEKKSRRDKEEK